ncbi:MAG: YfjI family protein [Pyrinomonadaceae bacterium]
MERGENVCGFPKLAELTDKKLTETVCKWLQIEHRQENKNETNHQTETPGEFTGDPKPLDLILKPVETVDEDCLPKILVDWLRPASKVVGCPLDFLVLSAIVTAGSLIGSRVRVKALRNSDWFVVPNLYGGIVGLPSTKKTPALDETRKPILELQSKARKEFSDKRKDFEIEAKYYERETTAIYREKLGLEETKAKIKSLSEPDQPIMRRYETNDITTPKLAQFLSENPNGLLQFRDELTGWLKSLDADYDTNARSLILELWKGAINYEKARVGDGEIQIPSGTLSIIGGIQPSKLQKYVAEAYSFDNSDGFLQRFLFVYPDIGKRPEKPTQSDYHALQNGFTFANNTFKKLAEYDFGGRVIGASGDHFHAIKFAPDAQKEIDEWKDETEAEAEKLQVEDEAVSSFLYKLPKNCFAVALIFHCLENINHLSFPDEITAATALKAITYIEVLKSHARRVFALGENQIFALANTLLGKIKKGNLPQGFTGREVMRKQWSGLKSKDTMQDVLNLLIDYGYLRELQTEGEGRRTIKYFFHPSLESEVKNEVEE